jgi:hypothetical protein
MLGMGQALGAGLEGLETKNALKNQTPPATPPATPPSQTSYFNSGYDYSNQSQIDNRFNFGGQLQL